MANIESRSFLIADLIRQVRRGDLRVPRFQRGFVWRHAQVLALLESLRARYPIGTLFVWRTSERYASFDRVGPVPVPEDSPKTPAPVGYLLDGHQRVSCLVGVLGLSEQEAASLSGSDRIFLVYFDLSEKKFVHSASPAEHQVPARYLLPNEGEEDDRLTEWLDKRRDSAPAGTEARKRWDQYRRDTLQLQTTLGRYLVRYDDVTEAGIDEAVEIFGLVNRQGTPARPEEVFSALAWRKDGFDFAERAAAITSSNPGFEDIDSAILLRALMRSLGRSVYERAWPTVLESHRDQLPSAMDRVGEAFRSAVSFLKRPELGVQHAKVLPYGLQLVVLTRFFELQVSPSPSQIVQLDRWFWATSFGATYGATGGLALDHDLERLEDLARGVDVEILDSRPVFQTLPRRFHPRAARVRALHLFLASLRPLDPRTGTQIPDPLKHGMSGGRAIVADKAWSLGARLLLGPDYKNPRKSLLAARTTRRFSEVLRSHAIPEPAFEALERGDDGQFVELHFAELSAQERSFAQNYTTLPPTEITEDEPELDADDLPI